MNSQNSHIIEFPHKKVRKIKTMSKKSRPFSELKKWFIKYRLRNGLERCYPILIPEKEELWGRLPKIGEQKELNFIEFDSLTHRILIQSSELMFFQFLFEPLYSKEAQDINNESVDSSAVKIYFIDNQNPMIFHVDADEYDPTDESDEGQMNNFVYYASNVCQEEEWLQLTDEDGETAFFKASGIALVEIPLKILQTKKLSHDS